MTADALKPKYSSYHDYVIQDGEFVGAFEEMYRDHDDPWAQLSKDRMQPDKALALNAIRRLLEERGSLRVLELGSGLGGFAAEIAETGAETIGLEISSTAVEKARARFDKPEFIVGDILDEDVLCRICPDLIVMCEISWYVLEKLEKFISMCRNRLPDVRLIHILTVYPPDEQRYGKSYFQDFEGIKDYFNVDIIEQAVIDAEAFEGTTRTYFLGHWPSK